MFDDPASRHRLHVRIVERDGGVEVHQAQGTPAVKEDISGLQVSVDDPLSMDVLEGSPKLLGVVEDSINWKRLARRIRGIDHILEAAPWEVAADHVRALVLVPVIDDRPDVGMVPKAAEDPGFPGRGRSRAGDRVRAHINDDCAIQDMISGEVHVLAGCGSQQALNLIAPALQGLAGLHSTLHGA